MTQHFEYWEYCYITSAYFADTNEIKLTLYNREKPYVHVDLENTLLTLIDDLGYVGWELVNVTDIDGQGYTQTKAYLKRKRSRE